jgi:hypothetical protein
VGLVERNRRAGILSKSAHLFQRARGESAFGDSVETEQTGGGIRVSCLQWWNREPIRRHDGRHDDDLRGWPIERHVWRHSAFGRGRPGVFLAAHTPYPLKYLQPAFAFSSARLNPPPVILMRAHPDLRYLRVSLRPSFWVYDGGRK